MSGTPTLDHRWISSPPGVRVRVRVRDGSLTLSSGTGAVNNKLCFQIVRGLPNELFNAQVNFQPTNVPIPTGWLADHGEVFGPRDAQPIGGLTYGWNSDNTANTRLRVGLNIPSPQEENATFIHMQKPDNPDAVWEIAVPNGSYEISASSGDAGYFDSVFRIQVEGIPLISGTPTATSHFVASTMGFPVTVTDGRLTVRSFQGAINNKINFIRIMEVPQSDG